MDEDRQVEIVKLLGEVQKILMELSGMDDSNPEDFKARALEGEELIDKILEEFKEIDSI